jgi:DNA-directed RNA polymerase specialized sigma24 family protein
MHELSLPERQQKKDWTLTSAAFDALLKWLDEGINSDGLRYLEIRRRLVAYFDRKNCQAPDELADETFNRVARRLEEEGTIETETPAKYCYIVARFVFMEYLRAQDKDEALRQTVLHQPHDTHEDQDRRKIRERMLDCLDRCIGSLDSAQRELILKYYFGKEKVKIENRRALAAELGITVNALSIRACRIRDKLEGCVKQCVGRD